MVRHGRSSAGSYLADPTSPIPSHCASIVATSTVRVKYVMHSNGDFNISAKWQAQRVVIYELISLQCHPVLLFMSLCVI